MPNGRRVISLLHDLTNFILSLTYAYLMRSVQVAFPTSFTSISEVSIVIKFKYNFLFGAAAVALFALNSAAQATDWVLYEDESTDEALVINNGGAHDGEQHICQDEDGNVGATKDSQGGRICSTAKGSSRQFYVLVDQQPPLSPSEDSSDEGAGSDLMDSVSKVFITSSARKMLMKCTRHLQRLMLGKKH